jgi:hypothetical protein
MSSELIVLTCGTDSKGLLELLDNDIEANYYTDTEHLLSCEQEVNPSDIRKFKVTIQVEEIT